MSTAFENGDIQLMAEYDFKSPINATVLICDSDDDINSSSEMDPNNAYANEDDIFIGTTSNINKKTSSVSKTVQLDKNETDNNEVQNNTEPRYQCQAKELLINNNNNNNMANPGCDKIIPREDQWPNNNQIASTVFQNRLESCLGGESQTPSNQGDINKKANECVQTLLNIVSDHMIFIMKAYIDYKAFTRTKTDRTVVENATKQFQKTKHKWFCMSFSAVANIMLPKENDEAFMQKFIENTVKIAQSKHLYFRQVDMVMVCKEMFDWVKTHTQQPTLVGLLNKEPQSTAITSNTNNRNLVACDKASNGSDSTYCIFTSGPTGREVTINVSSTDIHNSHNVHRVSLKQGAQPTSDETMSTDYVSHYSVQKAPLMQNLLTPGDDLRSVNSTNFIKHCTGQNTPSMQSVLEPSNEIMTNPNSINNTLRVSGYCSQNVAALQTVLPPVNELRKNANSANYISHYTAQNALFTHSVHSSSDESKYANSTSYENHNPVQNMVPKQNSLQVPSDQLKTNANSTNYASHGHMQNMKLRKGAQPARDKSKANANSTNYISHDPVQNFPRHIIQPPPPYRDVWRKNAASTNYIQEFEHFNTNYSYHEPVHKYKSQLYQSSNVRVQRETHHHQTHTPHFSRPPPYSTQTRHHDTGTFQNYSPNQVVNSTNCDNIQVIQESVEVNRSLSRDSGFMSPLTSAPQDSMFYSPTHDEMDSSSTLTPLITHVTSLNPSVAYIKDGICHVCGKLTKDKCLGCLKVYYCSHQCQIDDWKNHIYNCNF